MGEMWGGILGKLLRLGDEQLHVSEIGLGDITGRVLNESASHQISNMQIICK